MRRRWTATLIALVTAACGMGGTTDGGQPVVCLAGHDEDYATWGPELVTALREAGASWVVVAGRPEVQGRDLGVDDSAAVGTDAVAFLTTVRERLA